MNLIELLFRISPDGGNGSAELILIALFLALATAVAVRRPFGWR